MKTLFIFRVMVELNKNNRDTENKFIIKDFNGNVKATARTAKMAYHFAKNISANPVKMFKQAF